MSGAIELLCGPRPPAHLFLAALPIVVLWKLSRNELVAQSVEQRTFNAWVVGSIPTELTTFGATEQGWRTTAAPSGDTHDRQPALTPCL